MRHDEERDREDPGGDPGGLGSGRQLQPRAVKEVRDNLRAMEQARARQDAEDDALREDLLAKLIRDSHPGPGARPMLYVPAPKKVIV
jgi:hypothetical protein